MSENWVKKRTWEVIENKQPWYSDFGKRTCEVIDRKDGYYIS
jgi:hypothetical protein